MSSEKPFIMDTDYDRQNDSLLMYVKQDYNYKESLPLGNNLILDFDGNYVPVALEILDASRILKVNKNSLTLPFHLDMEIVIKEDCIRIKAAFKVTVHKKEFDTTPINAEIPNLMNIPANQSNYAVKV